MYGFRGLSSLVIQPRLIALLGSSVETSQARKREVRKKAEREVVCFAAGQSFGVRST